MTTGGADLLRFPPRRSAAVWILRDAEAWLVLAGVNGWAHGSRDEAAADADWLADNLAMPIRWEGV